MVRVRYIGVTAPAATFERYRAWRAELAALKGRCRPMGPDYLALDGVIEALGRCADHFTGEADFFRARAPNHSSR